MSPSTPSVPEPTAYQRQAMDEIRDICSASPELLKLRADHGIDHDGNYWLNLGLPTGEPALGDGGLRIRAEEQVTVVLRPTFPLTPPSARVEHARFVRHPHVLHGRTLCIYLDVSREWSPSSGVRGFLDRLWQWFQAAARGDFATDDALFHPVGGVLYAESDAPTIVVRDDHPKSIRHLHPIGVARRSSRRLDLSWDRQDGTTPALSIRTSDQLNFGPGTTLHEFIDRVDRPRDDNWIAYACHRGWPRASSIVHAMCMTAIRLDADSPLTFVVAVPDHLHRGEHHLIAGQLEPKAAMRLAAVASDRLASVTRARNLHVGQPIEVAEVPDMDIAWARVSDQRPSISRRRDATRPTAPFLGATVHIWGCGGLGSWIAELVVRAGAKRVVLSDTGRVNAGLLVRQNFSELDVGYRKADALRDRLAAISDRTQVVALPGPAPFADTEWQGADLVVDATVSRTVHEFLHSLTDEEEPQTTTVAQVATDVATGTLGLLCVSSIGSTWTIDAVDEFARKTVMGTTELEPFATFWTDPPPGTELTPSRGCSVPTFHASAADLAALAGSMVSLIGHHLRSPQAGTHLISLPHSDVDAEARTFLPMPPDVSAVGSDRPNVPGRR